MIELQWLQRQYLSAQTCRLGFDPDKILELGYSSQTFFNVKFLVKGIGTMLQLEIPPHFISVQLALMLIEVLIIFAYKKKKSWYE